MRLLALTALLAVAAGCSPEEKLFDVSGTVTFNGKPVAKGLIFFDPDPAKGGTGGQGYATISDGKYTTADGGKGIKGGAYAVRVNAFDGKTGPDSPFGNAVCPEYREDKEFPPAPTTFDVALGAGKKK